MLAHADDLGEAPVHARHPVALERQLRVGDGVAGEDALHALLLEAEADVVVLGETLHVEGDAVAVFQQRGDGAAAEAGADAGAGHLAGQRLAHRHVLAVVLGELVDVVARGEAGPFRGVGVDRDLDQVLGRQQVVEQAQLQRRDHVFGVMQDEAGELDAGVGLEAQDGVDDVVQAVGLAGGPGARADHLVHVGVVQAHRVDVRLGLRVVGVGADEDLVVFVVQGGGRQARHLAHHADLVPGRHHDRQRLFRGGEEAFLVGPVEAVVDAEAPDQHPAPVHQVDEQVIQAEQEHQRGEEDGQVLQRIENVREDVDQFEVHSNSLGVRDSPNQDSSRATIFSLAWPSP